MKWLLVAICLFSLGCGDANYKSDAEAASAAYSPPISFDSSVYGSANAETISPGSPPAKTPQETGKTTDRKIIYTAQVNVVVKNFDGIEEKIQKAIKDHGGYLAQAHLDRMQGERRSGRWTARIPVDRYDDFLKTIADLGIPTSQDQTSRDVTEEYIDLTARIENKKKLETRILQLLDRPDDEIQHVIEVEKELSRVREEIETMEGRIRYLSDQTAMTTVEIAVSEQKDYKPPQAPTFDNRISTAWSNSIDRSIEFFQDSVVFLTSNAIALAAWLVVVVVFWLVLGKRLWRKLKQGLARSASSEPVTEDAS